MLFKTGKTKQKSFIQFLSKFPMNDISTTQINSLKNRLFFFIKQFSFCYRTDPNWKPTGIVITGGNGQGEKLMCEISMYS